MNKLWQFFDEQILKWGVGFAILFVALYPKLPSIYITHTWVYVRAEDFVIAALVFVWIIQLVRRKVSLPFTLGLPIFIYWIVGLASLIFSLIFIGPTLANFFPKIAILSYLRRIEYMILFFVAFSTVKNQKDVRDYIKIILITITGIVFYGLGQRLYLVVWHFFPQFGRMFPFCFPSFQTTNEEFAKGIPLCLPFDGRITSTFGGHYDLAAYLVVVLPIVFGIMLASKKFASKVLLSLLYVFGLVILILTSSRISFPAYLLSATIALIFMKQKKYILPVIIVATACLFLLSGSTVKRFANTFRITTVVTNSQGQVVGISDASLPKDLQNRIQSSQGTANVAAPTPSQDLPTGSGFITLPQNGNNRTNIAVVQKQLSSADAKKNNFLYGGVQISTVSGNFTVQKALAYDISITTRFQGEWPHAWSAFMRNPALGSGYATITLAADNDYLRNLGETGLLGLTSFIFVFIMLGILLKEQMKYVTDPLTKAFLLSLAGGVIGLAFNAVLFDIFEASKVAESLWLFLGIGAGILLSHQKAQFNFIPYLRKIMTSHIFLGMYLIILCLVVFLPSLNNFFTADDFTWIKWAATTTTSDIAKYFTDASGFFYRPLDKFVILGLYSIFAFSPSGYHFFMLIVHAIIVIGVYGLFYRIWKHKLPAFVGAFLFAILPSHGENVFWISSISPNLATVFMLSGVLAFLKFKRNNSVVSYICSFLFAVLALLSYEMAVALPLVILISHIFIVKKFQKKDILLYIPYLLIDMVYFFIRSGAHALGMQGDYSYSVVHFIPNFLGNTIGYLGLSLIGEPFIPWYGTFRMLMKSSTLEIVIALVVILGLSMATYIKKKHEIVRICENLHVQRILLGLLFMIASVASFIGLGNIAERYIYLGSIGSLVVVLALSQMLLSLKAKKIIAFLLAFLFIFYSAYAISQLVNENDQWSKAGLITSNTLGFFKQKYPTLPAKSHLVFVNLPIKQGNAWVFPVGVQDGLWFVYRDEALSLTYVPTLRKAKEVIGASKKGSYIFSFDPDGGIEEEKL